MGVARSRHGTIFLSSDDDDAQAFIELLLDISLALNIVQNNAK